MNKDKKVIDDKLNFECESTKNAKTETATDIYYKTQCKLPESKVAIPTHDSVVEAKEWVDDRNKM